MPTIKTWKSVLEKVRVFHVVVQQQRDHQAEAAVSPFGKVHGLYIEDERGKSLNEINESTSNQERRLLYGQSDAAFDTSSFFDLHLHAGRATDADCSLSFFREYITHI